MNFLTQSKFQQIHTKYQIIQPIGKGSFGSVYKVKNRQSRVISALKLQIKQKKQTKITLTNEFKILSSIQGISGIPCIYGYQQTQHYIYLDLQIFKCSLDYLLEKQIKLQQQFVCQIAYQILRIFSQIHSKRIVHRDIKPENIMVDNNRKIYLIDYGISKLNNGIKSQSTKYNFIGTPRFASVNAHKKLDITALDDIESLMYVLIYCLRGTLPWMSLKLHKQAKMKAILQIKQKKSKKSLCQGLHNGIYLTFLHLASLKANKIPDYQYLMGLFKVQNNIFSDFLIEKLLFTYNTLQQSHNSFLQSSNRLIINTYTQDSQCSDINSTDQNIQNQKTLQKKYSELNSVQPKRNSLLFEFV